MKLTSITLTDYFADDLAKRIVEYLIKKQINSVKIIYLKEFDQKIEKEYIKTSYEKLKYDIESVLNSEDTTFYLNIPKIKTSFEEFIYGVDANSYEFDFKEAFTEYE